MLNSAPLALPAHVYHLAEAANWPSIQAHGLMSASALIARSDSRMSARTWRSAHTVLPSGAEIRDQLPMPPAALMRALVGMKPADWYALINARVFFWLDPDRLNRQRAAYDPRPQVVLTLSTAKLLARHAEQAAVSPINSGNARRAPARRSAATFVPYEQWRREGWVSEAAALGSTPRRRTHAPVELTIVGTVPRRVLSIAVVRVTRLGARESFIAR